MWLNVHLKIELWSLNCWNYWTTFVIVIKFSGYDVDWIHVCKLCKFGKYICYNSIDTEFFLGGYFFGAPCRCSEVHSLKSGRSSALLARLGARSRPRAWSRAWWSFTTRCWWFRTWPRPATNQLKSLTYSITQAAMWLMYICTVALVITSHASWTVQNIMCT